jgi:Transposase
MKQRHPGPCSRARARPAPGTPARHLGIDETARRHQYVTVVTDLDRSRVLFVADDRRRESLDGFWAQLKTAEGVLRGFVPMPRVLKGLDLLRLR